MLNTTRRLGRSLAQAAKRRPVLKRTYYQVRGVYHKARLRFAESRMGGARGKGVGTEVESRLDPAKMVWIFCTARSGSTWLRRMLEDLLPSETWEEPKVAHLFGEFYSKAQTAQRGSTNFVLGDPNREAWTRALRSFVLEMAWASNPSSSPERYLVVKEPGGGMGAPLLSRALPESRLIFLVRDPRDFVSSILDAQRKGNWMYEGMDEVRRGRKVSAEANPTAYARVLARRYVEQIEGVKRAYKEHQGPKSLIRYEDLRMETLATMRRLCTDLGLEIQETRLRTVVEAHSWENLPTDQKGAGKFHRKGQPSGWREDLEPGQVEIIEEITAPLLEEFYS